MAKTHEEIMKISAAARKAAGRESATWAEDSPYTSKSLEGMYEDYVVTELEEGHDDYWDFTSWCENEMHIPNETPEPEGSAPAE